MNAEKTVPSQRDEHSCQSITSPVDFGHGGMMDGTVHHAVDCCRGLLSIYSLRLAGRQPHFPALRSDPMALSGASRRNQIPCSQPLVTWMTSWFGARSFWKEELASYDPAK
jgi:hypothetical protein